MDVRIGIQCEYNKHTFSIWLLHEVHESNNKIVTHNLNSQRPVVSNERIMCRFEIAKDDRYAQCRNSEASQSASQEL